MPLLFGVLQGGGFMGDRYQAKGTLGVGSMMEPWVTYPETPKTP